MDQLDKVRMVSRSLESFQNLRELLAYLRSVSVIFESGNAEGHQAAIREKIKETAPAQINETELLMLTSWCSHAAMCVHMALLYTAIGFYNALIEANPALRHDKLDEELEAAKRNGLYDTMREFRNTVFHVRPSTRPEQLATDVVRRSVENRLEWNRLEELLFDATEKVFRNPEILFQEKKEVLEEGYRKALAYYEENLAGKNE